MRKRPHALRLIVASVLLILIGAPAARSSVPHLGDGFNVTASNWDIGRIQSIGFNWIKIFDAPTSHLPLFVLLRVDLNAQTSQGALIADLDLKLAHKANIDAWEIGNEPDIDANYGWNAAPDAIAYKDMLCAAYTHIKAADPDAMVVSAGLAPTGRVTGNFNGHPGNDGSKQDEREFLKEFFDNGGGACADAIGYHPYGFSANYDAAPDLVSSDPTQNCDQGFCFRGAEKIYEIMQQTGFGDKKVWATEFGWITRPPANCLSDPGWGGREWQIVSDEKQASNLVGAYQYADANWPWMGGLFVFNLNYNVDPQYPECEQMRHYSVQGHLAEGALTAMPKSVASILGNLKINPKSILALIEADWQPVTTTQVVALSNYGWQSFTYTATASTSAPVVPVLVASTGTVSPMALVPLQIVISSTGRSIGVYTGTVSIVASPGALGSPRTVPIELHVVQQVYQAYLPLVSANSP